MTCEEAVEWMQRNLDHELDDSEREAMLAHMSRCKDCTEMYTRLQQLSLELASLPKILPPISLVDAILPRLDEIDRQRMQEITEDFTSAASTHPLAPEAAKRGWLGRWKRTFPYGAVGGVVAAGVMLALFMTNPNGFMKSTNDEATVMSQELADRSEKQAAVQPMSKKQSIDNGSRAESSASQSVEKKAPASAGSTMESASPAPAPTAGQVASALTGNTSGGTAPTKSVTPAPASSNPTGAPVKGGDKTDGDEVSVTEAPRMFGQLPPEINTGSSDIADTYATADPPNPSSTNASTLSTEGPVTTGSSPQDTSGAGARSTGGEGSAAGSAAAGSAAAGSFVQNVDPAADKKSVNEPPIAGLMPTPGHGQYFSISESNPAVRLVSPDKQLVAVYSNDSRRVVVIKSAGEEAVVYTSSRQWGEQDLIILSGWTQNSKITYTVTQGTVVKTYVIDLELKQESEAPTK